MPIQEMPPERVELSTIEPENFLLVENHPHYVLIRAVRDNFSAHRKSCFIRHLAVEGYIPDRFAYLGISSLDEFSPITWVVDRSWIKFDPTTQRKTDRFMIRLIVYSFLLWVGLMLIAFCGLFP